MEQWPVIAGGFIGIVASLATALVTHYLKRDERRETARAEFEKERMAAWALLHGEGSKHYDHGDRSLDLEELLSAYHSLVSTFLPIMHYLDEPTRLEIRSMLAGVSLHTCLAGFSDTPQDVRDNHSEAIAEMHKLYVFIGRRHEEEAALFFRTHNG